MKIETNTQLQFAGPGFDSRAIEACFTRSRLMRTEPEAPRPEEEAEPEEEGEV